MKSRMLVWACVGSIFFLSPVEARSTDQAGDAVPFKILRQDSDGWTVEYKHRPVPFTTVEIDGSQYMVFQGPEGQADGEDGTPQLPVEVVSLGIPFNSSVVVQLIDPVYQIAENQLVAPKPTYRFTDENEAIAEYKKDPTAYSENRFFSPPQITVETPLTLRHQRISTIRLSPYQYNPATKIMKTLVSATLKVTLRSNPKDAPLRFA